MEGYKTLLNDFEKYLIHKAVGLVQRLVFTFPVKRALCILFSVLLSKTNLFLNDLVGAHHSECYL